MKKDKLKLNHETVRVLASSDLARVPGGQGANSDDGACAPTQWETCRVSCAGTCHTPCGTQDPTGAGNKK